MSGLALVAHALGASVTGSDRSVDTTYAARLRAAGIAPVAGHAADNVPDGAEVVLSSAIPVDNPERVLGNACIRSAPRIFSVIVACGGALEALYLRSHDVRGDKLPPGPRAPVTRHFGTEF